MFSISSWSASFSFFTTCIESKMSVLNVCMWENTVREITKWWGRSPLAPPPCWPPRWDPSPTGPLRFSCSPPSPGHWGKQFRFVHFQFSFRSQRSIFQMIHQPLLELLESQLGSSLLGWKILRVRQENHTSEILNGSEQSRYKSRPVQKSGPAVSESLPLMTCCLCAKPAKTHKSKMSN